METMEWAKQSEEMFKGWADVQKKMWGEWFRAVEGLGHSQSSEAWQKTVSAWSDSINKTLDTQLEWTRVWAENFTGAKGATEEISEWAKHGQSMMRHWTETQKQLWASWFDIVKKFDPSTLTVNWGGDSQKFLQNWQETVRRALDSQATWMRMWPTGEKKSKGREGA